MKDSEYTTVIVAVTEYYELQYPHDIMQDANDVKAYFVDCQQNDLEPFDNKIDILMK